MSFRHITASMCVMLGKTSTSATTKYRRGLGRTNHTAASGSSGSYQHGTLLPGFAHARFGPISMRCARTPCRASRARALATHPALQLHPPITGCAAKLAPVAGPETTVRGCMEGLTEGPRDEAKPCQAASHLGWGPHPTVLVLVELGADAYVIAPVYDSSCCTSSCGQLVTQPVHAQPEPLNRSTTLCLLTAIPPLTSGLGH
jgi:hypothetical protein